MKTIRGNFLFTTEKSTLHLTKQNLKIQRESPIFDTDPRLLVVAYRTIGFPSAERRIYLQVSWNEKFSWTHQRNAFLIPEFMSSDGIHIIEPELNGCNHQYMNHNILFFRQKRRYKPKYGGKSCANSRQWKEIQNADHRKHCHSKTINQ